MTTTTRADSPREYYTSDAVRDSYVDAVEDGLSERERRLVARFFERGDRVLDLGCGGGRTTGPLVARGLDVVAGDVEREFVAAASDHVFSCERQRTCMT